MKTLPLKDSYKRICMLAVLMLFFMPTFAQSVRVAVAANATFVVKQLAAAYTKKTGVAVEVIGGSSGKLATQIKNGAPYDVFLSADMEFANDVYQAGLALNQPKVYALGSLIVCSTTGADVKNWKQLISRRLPGKIGIANPELAPYGKAAVQSLKKLNLYDAARSRMVFAESINQVNTYVLKGAVNIGFTTESLVYELPQPSNLKWERVDSKTYETIKQGAVLLKYAKNNNYSNSKGFFDYLFSASAKSIFKKFGYRSS